MTTRYISAFIECHICNPSFHIQDRQLVYVPVDKIIYITDSNRGGSIIVLEHGIEIEVSEKVTDVKYRLEFNINRGY